MMKLQWHIPTTSRTGCPPPLKDAVKAFFRNGLVGVEAERIRWDQTTEIRRIENASPVALLKELGRAKDRTRPLDPVGLENVLAAELSGKYAQLVKDARGPNPNHRAGRSLLDINREIRELLPYLRATSKGILEGALKGEYA